MRFPLCENDSSTRRGQWKDGIFACFKHGIWHPHLWMGWICPQILLGQILTRMKMTFSADPSPVKMPYQSTFRTIFSFVVIFAAIDLLWAPPMLEFFRNDDGNIAIRWNNLSGEHNLLYLLFTLPSALYAFMVVVKLRAAIRAKYEIPTGRLGDFEDCCCVCWCNCCVLSQMARQTTDYRLVNGSLCSANGIYEESMDLSCDKEVPLAVVV